MFSGCAYHGGIAGLPDASIYNQAVVFGGARYVPLLRFCDYYNLDWDWDLAGRRIEIKRGDKTLVLRPDSDLALVGDKTIRLERPVEYKEGAAYIPAESAILISRDIFGLEEKAVPAGKIHRMKTVVIDPGHGGRDPGATSRYGTREKHIVLDVSKRLKRHLERQGLNVILTRTKDVFVSLRKRAQFANAKNADLFISVHANAVRRHQSRVKGFEVFYLSEATDDRARALAAVENASLKFEEGEISSRKNKSTATTVWDMQLKENRRVSKELAYYICNITSDRLGMRNRGVKGARFAVLKGTRMPAVLVEVGFLTNRREESNLKKRSFREKIAENISRAIVAYKKEYEKTDGFSR